MERTRPAVLAMLFSGLAAGFALCINVVHYRTWPFVPPSAFQRFQDASGAHTVPAAALLGLASLVLAVVVARRGLPGVSRGLLWAAAALALVPWVATPVLFLPLQGQLAATGPSAALVSRLASADLLLRAIPPVAQALIHWWALSRAVGAGGRAGAGRVALAA